jgi:hypothetical protein
MDPETALEFFRLRMRAEIMQVLVLRTYVIAQFLLAPDKGASASVQSTLAVLEETAAFVDQHFLADPVYRGLDDAQRALYADEFREIVEDMKSSVSSMSEFIEKRGRR